MTLELGRVTGNLEAFRECLESPVLSRFGSSGQNRCFSSTSSDRPPRDRWVTPGLATIQALATAKDRLIEAHRRVNARFPADGIWLRWFRVVPERTSCGCCCSLGLPAQDAEEYAHTDISQRESLLNRNFARAARYAQSRQIPCDKPRPRGGPACLLAKA